MDRAAICAAIYKTLTGGQMREVNQESRRIEPHFKPD